MTDRNEENNRRTKDEDWDHLFLTDQHTGIFHGVRPESIAQVRKSARVRYLEKGDILFKQGDVATEELPLFIVLSGVYEVWHELPDQKALLVGRDEAGGIIGDAEMLLLEMPENLARRGKRNTARSTIRCASRGHLLRIAPADVIAQCEDHRLNWNLAKSLALKLINRNATLDPGVFEGSRNQIVNSLKRLAEEKLREDSITISRETLPDYLSIASTQIDFAKSLISVGKGTVSRFYVDIMKPTYGCEWIKNGRLIVTKAFLEELLYNSGELTKRRQGTEMVNPDPNQLG